MGQKKRKIHIVNIYDMELKLSHFIEIGQNDPHIKKPIAWALYQTWKWADKHENTKGD